MERKDYLDTLKGIAIFLVVFAYFEIYAPLKNLIYTFHMPLFMFLSGCTFFYNYSRQNAGNLKDLTVFMLKKARALLVPYLFFVLMARFLFGFHGQGVKAVFLDFAIDFKTLQSLWFLPTLFGIQCVFSLWLFALKNDRPADEKQKYALFSVLIMGSVAGLLVINRITQLEVFRKVAIYMIPFFVGFSIEKNSFLKRICSSEVFCTLAIIFCCFLIPRYSMDDKGFAVLFLRLVLGILISLLLYKVFSAKQSCLRKLPIQRFFFGGGQWKSMCFMHSLPHFLRRLTAI